MKAKFENRGRVGEEEGKNVRVAHAVDEGLAAVGGPVVEERLGVPDGLEEDERDPDGVCGWAAPALVEYPGSGVDCALDIFDVALRVEDVLLSEHLVNNLKRSD